MVINHTANVRMREIEWGADILPGFLITPQTLAHVTVGFAGNKATLYENTSYSTAAGIVAATSAAQSVASTTKSLYGLRLGLGIQQAITNKVRLTADYVYTDYGTVSVSTQANAVFTPALNGGLSNTTSVKLHSQAIMFGLLIQL